MHLLQTEGCHDANFPNTDGKEVVIMTTSGAFSDDKIGTIMTLGFQCLPESLNTLRPRQNGRHFTDDPFKCIFLSETVRISINISLKFVPEG